MIGFVLKDNDFESIEVKLLVDNSGDRLVDINTLKEIKQAVYFNKNYMNKVHTNRKKDLERRTFGNFVFPEKKK